MRHIFYLSAVAIGLATSLYAAPTVPVQTADMIVVTGSPWYVPPTQLGFKSQFISANAIENTGATNIADISNRFTNTYAVNSGYKNSVFIRGLPSRFSKVMINGMDTKDPTEPNGSPFWDGVNLGTIDEIQYVEGTQGALLGTSAITGALNFVVDPIGTETTIRGGDRYYQVHYKTGQKTKEWDWALVASRESDNRFSATTAEYSNDLDLYQSNNLLGRLAWKSDEMTWSTQVMHVVSETGLDNYDNDDDRLQSSIWRFGSTAEWGIDSDQKYGIRVSRSVIRRDDNSGYTTEYQGDSNSIDIYSEWSLDDTVALLGSSYEIENGSSSATAFRVQNTAAIYTAITKKIGKVELNGSLRLNSDYANRIGLIGGLGAVVSLNPVFQIKANANTGFRSASLYENSNTSNDLLPEGASSIDLGLFADLEWISGHVSGYYSEIQNRIKDFYGPSPNYTRDYGNLSDQSKITGIEIGTSVKGVGKVVYSTTSSASDSLGDDARIPRFKWVASTSQTFGDVVISAQFQSVGERRDSLYADTLLAEYAVTDINAQFKGIPNWTPFIGVNNIFDKDYELASGYTKGSRTLILGLTYRID